MTTYALLHTIFFFFVYAFLGWCVEVAYAAITTRELVNRGFLNGPICPIYGCGMTVMIAVLGRFTMPSSDMAWYQNVLVAFFGGMVITTLVELVGGYILYKIFHTRWWDYSMYRFNLGGFICPCHGSTFDFAGRVFRNKPAPSNLEVPPHTYLSETRILIGEDKKGA